MDASVCGTMEELHMLATNAFNINAQRDCAMQSIVSYIRPEVVCLKL